MLPPTYCKREVFCFNMVRAEMDRVSERKEISGDWTNGPWRPIMPGEDVPSEHRTTGPNGNVIIPVRIYGLGITEGRTSSVSPMTQEPQSSVDLSGLRLSKGALRLVSDAQSVGIDPSPALETASATHTGSKICVKGPLVGLRLAVEMARAMRG